MACLGCGSRMCHSLISLLSRPTEPVRATARPRRPGRVPRPVNRGEPATGSVHLAGLGSFQNVNILVECPIVPSIRNFLLHKRKQPAPATASASPTCEGRRWGMRPRDASGGVGRACGGCRGACRDYGRPGLPVGLRRASRSQARATSPCRQLPDRSAFAAAWSAHSFSGRGLTVPHLVGKRPATALRKQGLRIGVGRSRRPRARACIRRSARTSRNRPCATAHEWFRTPGGFSRSIAWTFFPVGRARDVNRRRQGRLLYA